LEAIMEEIVKEIEWLNIKQKKSQKTYGTTL
jgi:hypothetical protein